MPSVTLHGYLPNGVAIEIFTDADRYEEALALSNQWLAAGMLIAPPSTEGEQIETIGYAVRMEKVSARDGDIAHYIDLYYDHPDVIYKLLSIYLNTAEQTETFENATGLKVNDMPLWDGGHINRGEKPGQDKYIVRVPKLPRMAWKQNPKHDPKEIDAKKKKPLRLFVRWLDASAMPSESRQDAPNSNAADMRGVVDTIIENNAAKTIDSEWARDPKRVGNFIAMAHAQYGLSHGEAIKALHYISPDAITNVEQFVGTPDEARAACIALKCNYNPDEVRVYLGDNVAMATYVIDMIELHQIPF